MPNPVSLDTSLKQNLGSLQGPRPVSTWRERIAQGLEDLKEHYRASLVMKRVHKGQEKTYSLDKVEAQLGLASHTQKSIMDYAGIAGNIYGKTAKEVQEYIRHERDSWEK